MIRVGTDEEPMFPMAENVLSLIEEDMATILKYGIACRRNTRMVKMAERAKQ